MNEGQQPFVLDIQGEGGGGGGGGGGGELQGLSHFMRLVLGSLLVSALTFFGCGWLLSCWLIFLNWLVYDHDCLGCYSDIILQC